MACRRSVLCSREGTTGKLTYRIISVLKNFRSVSEASATKQSHFSGTGLYALKLPVRYDISFP